ncbi:hypothetical protein EVAR_93055_1 [Eumeta japonica]|uniref:Uncharacterized protein n=1 Tax=Eumeta variegata TaxID=151549 RepID=A0A4C1TF03_EUMVA|nr:hypothetical protein EVAR_93055_1 [Eumeta japonica]
MGLSVEDCRLQTDVYGARCKDIVYIHSPSLAQHKTAISHSVHCSADPKALEEFKAEKEAAETSTRPRSICILRLCVQTQYLSTLFLKERKSAEILIVILREREKRNQTRKLDSAFEPVNQRENNIIKAS